jgi:hypothetical protein
MLNEQNSTPSNVLFDLLLRMKVNSIVSDAKFIVILSKYLTFYSTLYNYSAWIKREKKGQKIVIWVVKITKCIVINVTERHFFCQHFICNVH